MQRRDFLRLGVGGAAAFTAVARGPDHAVAQGTGPFRHGVASGDPLPDRIILWTRVTPSEDALPGSGRGVATKVEWEIATDPAFDDAVDHGELQTAAASDHTVKVDAANLRPDTAYWYRFTAQGEQSAVGRTRTAPATGADLEALRLGVVTCSNWEGGFFSAYRHLAERDDLAAVVHLGDYLYEYGMGGYGNGPGFGRTHDPVSEIVTVGDYRRRHAQYKTDPHLAAVHRRHPFIATIDDHEVANDAYGDGAENHQSGEGSYTARRAAALQAYFEWMPIRPAKETESTTRLWRKLSFGGLVDLFMLDERSHRSKQPAGNRSALFITGDEPDAADRTMLGQEQLTFLEDGLRGSRATWKLIGNPVMFSPLRISDIPATPAGQVFERALTGLGLTTPLVINGDLWDGYRAEQSTLTRLFGEVGNVVLMTGDIHSSWAAEVPVDQDAYLGGGRATAAVEFVTPSVSSTAFRQQVEESGINGAAALAGAIPQLVETLTPWFKYVDAEHHGYGVIEITPEHAQFDWFVISDRTDPDATSAFAAAWKTDSGTNRLAKSTVLESRPLEPAADESGGDSTSGNDSDGALIGVGAGVAVVAAVAAGIALRNRRSGDN